MRRTHKNTPIPNVATCATTGEKHLMHRAYRDEDGNMYYRGQLLVKGVEEV